MSNKAITFHVGADNDDLTDIRISYNQSTGIITIHSLHENRFYPERLCLDYPIKEFFEELGIDYEKQKS